jgi:nucleotide-binding universal stress UspA family protein
MYRNVMVPLDGSTFSEQALDLAIPIARRADATLHLVLVHSAVVPSMADVAPVALYHAWEEDHRAKEAAYLERTVAAVEERGAKAVPQLRDGDVEQELVARATSDMDLAILATHGRGGLERAWLGSVADGVVRHVRLPVLLVRPESGESARPPGDLVPQHILAATGGSEAGDASVREAARLARLMDARLTVLRVVSFPAGLASPYIPHAAEMDRELAEQREEEARGELEQLAAGIELAGFDTRVDWAYHPARGILQAVDEVGADLVAVGTHRTSRVARAVLGSVADKVVRASPVPVLVGHARREGDRDEG